jgi:hypothetical protein
VQIGPIYECRINNNPFNHILEVERNKIHFTSQPTSNISKSDVLKNQPSNFNFDSNSSIDDFKSLSGQDKLFNFSIKSSNNQSKRGGLFSFKKNENLQNKNLNSEFREFFSEANSTSLDIKKNLLDPFPFAKETYNTSSLRKESVDNKNSISTEENSLNLLKDTGKNENKSSNDINDLFEIFNNQKISNHSLPIESKNEILPEKAELKNSPNELENCLNYPNFDNLSEFKLPIYNPLINKSNNEENNKPQLNRIIKDIDDLFV